MCISVRRQFATRWLIWKKRVIWNSRTHSAGRKPSDKAYRLYVDTWMKVSTLNQEEIGFVQQYLNAKVSEVNNVVEATAQALSDMTNLTSLVLVPQLDRFELKRIQIVKIAQDKALVVLVFSSGIVKDVLISVPADIEEAYLENISNWLTSMAVGKRLDEALSEVRGAAAGELEAYRAFAEQLLNAVMANLQAQAKREVVLGGAQNIFNHPEYQDIDKARRFLTLLETKDTLYKLLAGRSNMEFTIRIGKENQIPELEHMSVVTASYRINKGKVGTFGVIGPTRMNYAKILSILHSMSASMNELFAYGQKPIEGKPETRSKDVKEQNQ
ncbi:MAG: heat-inducible transcriptional repressor HrcA [Christensenellaceae bacterium]